MCHLKASTNAPPVDAERAAGRGKRLATAISVGELPFSVHGLSVSCTLPPHRSAKRTDTHNRVHTSHTSSGNSTRSQARDVHNAYRRYVQLACRARCGRGTRGHGGDEACASAAGRVCDPTGSCGRSTAKSTPRPVGGCIRRGPRHVHAALCPRRHDVAPLPARISALRCAGACVVALIGKWHRETYFFSVHSVIASMMPSSSASVWHLP